MAGSPQLLLVNSDDEKSGVLSRFLTEHTGYDVICADSGTSAVNALKHFQIQCVISDIFLHDIDGWRLARMVRSGVFNCSEHIPFIIVASTWCKRIAEKTAKEFGIDHLLPFEQHNRLPTLVTMKSCREQRLARDRVLAIEDSAETADLVQRILKQRFEVDLAPDGPSGLALWREKRHSIVLLDVMLPGMSGPEVMQQMLSEKPDQTIVIMTAHGTMDLAGDLLLQGAADFISKPFQANQLRRVCEIAAHREDFLISNEQFAETVASLEENKAALLSLAREHKDILDNLSTAVLELDSNGQIVFVNQTWTEITGRTGSESQGQKFTDFVFPDASSSPNEIRQTLKRLTATGSERFRLEFKLKDKFDEAIWVEARFNGIQRDPHSPSIFVALDDITARRRAEQRLEHLAMHDTLTGLLNRHYFDNELIRITATAEHDKVCHALLYIDLNHFKAINDTQGHSRGDQILKDVASKLQEQKQLSDGLFRIGGDEFILLKNDTNPSQALRAAWDICNLLELEKYQFDDQAFKVSCCIGISLIDGSLDKPQDYLQQADIALYVAKRQGPGRVHLHTAEDQESDEVRLSMHWLHTVKHAIEQDQILLHFQPVYHIPSSKIAYHEALVRLVIDDELIYPGQFISALERFHEASLLDQHVISKAIKTLAEKPNLKRLAINLSAQAFHNEQLVPLIKAKLQEYSVDPGRVIFELTESASLTDLTATQAMVQTLAEMGCSFSIDDFGTGFSTFSYLKALPADTVKIDGSFVKELKNSEIDRALIRSIREVAWALGKVTVAEFVEDQETLDLLREIKVEYAQGYFIGKPAPIEMLKI